ATVRLSFRFVDRSSTKEHPYTEQCLDSDAPVKTRKRHLLRKGRARQVFFQSICLFYSVQNEGDCSFASRTVWKLVPG
ncbi:hypothetical protein PGIGA_G00235610, partial [Pangasianodon gigas]|nr:hypothetical protein [Pangasianodon gigas]